MSGLRAACLLLPFGLGCATSTHDVRVEYEGVEVAVVQYLIRGDATLDQIEAAVRAHVDEASGAELVVFPELFMLDGWPLSDERPEGDIVRELARTLTPRLRALFADLARAKEVAILAGSMPELRDGRMYNTARLYFSDGRVEVQDKVRLTAWGKSVGFTPGSGIRVFDSPWGRTAVLVCYDVEFPDISAGLMSARPEVLLVPSMTESRHGAARVRWAAQARAVEHHALVVVAPTVGAPSADWRHYGRALFLSPRDVGWTGVYVEGVEGFEDVVRGRLDVDRLQASRNTTDFWPARDAAPRP